MNYLDIFIIICLAISFFFGWKLRAISLFGMVISLIAGIWVGNHFHPHLIGLYRDLPAAVGHTLAWVTAFLAAAITLSIAFGLISKIFEVIRLQWLDHLLGAALAITLMLGMLIISMTVIDNLAKNYHWKVIKNSTLAPFLVKTARPYIQQGLEKFPRWKQMK
ncbi:CvpA family protein [bacterium]|nr:CvpA family protein [bacterium]